MTWIQSYGHPFRHEKPPQGEWQGAWGIGHHPGHPPLGCCIQLRPATIFFLSRCAWQEAPSRAGSPMGTRGCDWPPVSPAASETWQAPTQHLVSFTAFTHTSEPSWWGYELLCGKCLGIIIFYFLFLSPQLIYGGGGQRAGKGRRFKNSNSGGFCEQKRQENIIWGETCCQLSLPVLSLLERRRFSHGRVLALFWPEQGGKE